MQRRVADLRQFGRSAFAHSAELEPSRTVDLLLSDILMLDRAALIAHDDRVVSETDELLFRERIARIASGEPLAYVRGKQEFYGIELLVDRRVLIPRPETELLVDLSLAFIAKEHSKVSLIDVGTGSGAIVLAILAELRTHREHDLFPLVRAIGVDIEVEALAVAQENAKQLGLEDCVKFFCSDLLAGLPSELLKSTDPAKLVVANLPYIGLHDQVQESVKRFEPPSALWAGEEGLDFITRLIEQIFERATTGTTLLLEVGAGQAAQVESLLHSTGYCSIVRHRDLQQIERVLEARI